MFILVTWVSRCIVASKFLGKRICSSVTTSWVSNATLFPAEIVKENLAELSCVSGLPEPIAKLVTGKIDSWFPVQKAVLPCLLKDIVDVPVIRPRDIAISAPTGSGKTLCYVLPVLAQVGIHPRGQLRALVVVPVQTLVKQIEEEFNAYNACGAVISALSGATDFRKEQRTIAPEGVCISDVIISTPGRLMDHLTNPASVVDEADRMGTMVRQEWLAVVERRSGGLMRATCLADILATRWAPRKILLSATLSRDVEELHMWNLHQPRLFRADDSSSKEVSVDLHSLDHVSGALSLPSTIRHTVLAVEQKFHPLMLYLKVLENDWKRVLVFTNEKESSLRLSILVSRLAKSKFTVEQLTSDLYGNRRAKVLKRFKNGTTRVLICSDVLSRGVDVEDIDCVVNYDLPKNDRLFVHRAGRTGRAGKSGHVLSLADGEARKIFVKNVLKKNGLWVNAEEIEVEKGTLEPHLHRYEKALAHLKKTLEERKAINPASKRTKSKEELEEREEGYWALRMSGNGLLTDIISDSLALNASQEWEDVFLYTPFLNDQALSYEYAECLAAQAFLRMVNLSYFVKQRPNAEFISPTGKVPLLKVRRTLVPEFSGIVDFVAKKGIKLCAHLSDAQVAEMRAHMSVMDVLLRNVEMYVMWKHNETYTQTTRYRYGSVYKWPLNWILPIMKRREIVTKLQDSGWAEKSTEEVLEQYDKALRALSLQLGSKPYLFGNQPTEADALLFGHLFTIITMTLPCMDLKNAILNYQNLQDFVTRVETEYFKI
ncbi:hypothetical protein OESDEN_04315 [Oesophagostomum dentatum]|uniref:ATP-dependent RNA helicase n=1 Tax=Oesophagostomum dentatum TaxID=61180 RepID=A0A0B1TEQ1_OESDE|nr:hypothetical protein OESDEN_04315 [Oesophagostomum dentatum]